MRKERQLLGVILRHLREIERRRLFSALGYSSLFTYCVGRLKFSEDEACRRISAMRLHRELPEVEEIQVSLTNLSRAESTILRELENKSVREGEKILARYAPRAPKPDRVRAVAEGAIEVRFQASQELREKIEILKGLLAHKHPNIPLGELFEKLCDLGIETWDPGRPPKQAARARKANSPAAQQVSAPLHRLVWQKARNNQIDHRIPRAQGGPNTPENLRLLCRSCN